jgi:hypothetical protein
MASIKELLEAREAYFDAQKGIRKLPDNPSNGARLAWLESAARVDLAKERFEQAKKSVPLADILVRLI